MATQLERLRESLSDRYEVERELGQGGMATVYLALDRKHARRVALKVLRKELAAVIGAERFLTEIRVTANLHHPNIVQLYDSGEADGLLYYAMPSIEGESLRDKLSRESQLPIDEAVDIAQAVAAALDYAHRRKVIHRDIKPDNILLHEGTPMVSDFGIALAVTQVGGERITETGLSLGTPSYMSPEQATGDRDLDGRSDIYALGSVLYEMLAGDPPFLGSNTQAVIARLITERPVSLRTIRETVPPHVEAAVERALAKVPADRFRSAREFSEALEGGAPAVVTGETPAAAAGLSHPAAPRPTRAWTRQLAITAFVVAAAAVAAWLWAGRGEGPPAERGTTTVRPVTNFEGWEWAPSWSPDGSMITYTHVVQGDADVAVLATGGGDPHLLTETSPADEINPRWSPDGSKIAYISDRGTGSNVYWIAPTGGAEHKIVETRIPFLERMGAWAWSLGSNPWSPDGQELLFSRLQDNGDVGLWKVNLATREEQPVTTPPPGAEDGAGAWSPDGETILFVRNQAGINSFWLLPARGGEPSLLLDGQPLPGTPAWYPDSRRLVLTSVRGGAPNLWELDTGSGEFRQLTVGAGVDWSANVARDGSIAYVQFGHQIDLYWIALDDPEAPQERLTTYTGSNFGARVSPDGTQVVYYSNRSGNFDLWILDRATGQHRQLTTDPASDRLSDWSPDGREIVFMSDRDGAVRLWIVNVETGAVRQLTSDALPWSNHDAEGQGGPRWSPDGGTVGYLAPGEGNAIWLIAPDGTDRRPSSVRGALSFGWYRDGQRVVYTRRAPDGSGAVELRAAHLRSGEDVLLRSGAIAEVAVSPDGSGVTFIEAVSHFTMELYLLPLTPAGPDELPAVAGAPRQITFGEGAWHVHSGGWAPDGRGVVYSRDRDFGDIYVIQDGP